MINTIRLIILFVFAVSCQTGKLEVIADISNELDEISAAELAPFSEYIWTIEDSGNKNHLYGLDLEGSIKADITLKNADNIDWEDLTSDDLGNIYVGDFGNNTEDRELFTIYKVSKDDLIKSEVNAERIDFTLPEDQDSKDFESFFILNNQFYIFSKETKKFIVLKVPNVVGQHEAIVHEKYNLNGQDNQLTSADVSRDGNRILLLTDDKLWDLRPKDSTSFFSGKITKHPFEYKSQNEGVCFANDSIVYVTDERNSTKGGNIYKFSLN